MIKRLALLIVGLVLASSLPTYAAPKSAKSQPPSQIVKNFYDKLSSVMKDGDRLGFEGREKALTPALQNAFNFPLMTRVAVGPLWSEATPDEQSKLISAFSQFSIANYASQFAKFNGEKFEVTGQRAASDGGTIVETNLIPGGQENKPVALNYLLKQDDKGNWRIVDVFLDGAISELATRRSEFSSIVQRDGIPALVNDLGQKSKDLNPS